MSAGKRPQYLAFALVSILLVASGLAFSSSRPGVEHEEEAGKDTVATAQLEAFARRVEANTARLRVEVEGTAQRFVDAYLQYEVGIIDAGVRAAIRGSATTEFASVLLANTPRAPAATSFPEQARLQSLEVSFETAEGNRAVVDGAAMRGRMPERFSFELSLVGGVWRVSGVAG